MCASVGGVMGTIFISGAYGVGKSGLCGSLSSMLNIPAFSASDLISNVNGEKYGANKIVQNVEDNQNILIMEVNKKLIKHPKILLAGHFCVFNVDNSIEIIPYSILSEIQIEKILLLEAEPVQIQHNLCSRDKKEYELDIIQQIVETERCVAETLSKQQCCALYVHQMSFDEIDLEKCYDFICRS